MPTAITDTPSVPPPLDPPRKRWTREECVALEALGIWDQQHLELIEGELISKMGKKRPHANAIAVLHAWLLRVFGEKYVNQEAPIDVAPENNPTNEPEPDLIVFFQALWRIRKQPTTGGSSPGRGDFGLDSELRFDHQGPTLCARPHY